MREQSLCPRTVSVIRSAPVVLAVTALVLSACGGSSSSAADVATLTDDSTATTTDGAGTDGGDGSTEADAQQAALDFAQCMRDNGVDVADPTLDADGGFAGGLITPDSGIDPGSEAFQAAMDECGDLLEGVAFGGRGGDGFDTGALEEALLDFSECLRDEGLDVGDIELGGPGPGGAPGEVPADGEEGGQAGPPDGEAGTGGGPGPGAAGLGDPTARMIEALGLDPDDPAVGAAMEACQPVLEDTFQGGPGGEPGAAGTTDDES